MIKGLNKRYWKIVFELGSEAEVAKWSPDKLLEAYAALSVFNEEYEESIEEEGG